MRISLSRNKVIFIIIAIIILVLAGVLIYLWQKGAFTPGVSVNETAHNDGQCVIGWLNNHQNVSSTSGGYLSYATLNAAKPAGATIKIFDLDKNPGSLTAANLGTVDLLVTADAGDDRQRTDYTTMTNAQLNIIKNEFNVGMDVFTNSDNAGTAALGRQYAAMTGMPIANALSGGAINFQDKIVSVIQTTGTTSNTTYPFLSGFTYNTTGSGRLTPGIVSVSGSAVCAASVNYANNSGNTCLLSYLPPAGTAGFLLVNGNGGTLATPVITSQEFWKQIPDCAPVPPVQCGNQTVETGEECDNGTNNGQLCSPAYGSTCTYCTTECKNATLQGAYCGDGIKNGTEQCDGQDTPAGRQCSSTCTLLDPLQVDKTSAIQSVSSDQAVVNYTVKVTNSNAEIMNGKVVDQLPSFVQTANVTVVSDSGVFDNTAKTITWDPISIPASSSKSFTYTLTVAAANYGAVVNTATVFDPDGTEVNHDTETVTLSANIQVSVDKTHTKQVSGGNNIVAYSVLVKNLNTTQLTSLSAEDTLPIDVQSDWVTNISNSGTLSGRTISWTGLSLAAQGSLTLTYTVTYPAGTSGTFANNVIVKNNQDDPIGQDTDTITLTNTTSLPDTALFDNSNQFILIGAALMLLGIISYKLKVGEGLGRSLLNFVHDTAENVSDNINPNDFEARVERKSIRKAKQKNHK